MPITLDLNKQNRLILNMNGSNYNETISECFLGSCSFLNLSTCTQDTPQENITDEPLSIDQDGCFDNIKLRLTDDYQNYKMVLL